ncbi:hypothetical protein [Gimesia sp.]|uniref:hypothetical protein n=1 Tax=Gimesia sp. TaxID=2024833 RepID=UPI000C6A56F6|nr:hypothetical protein [Gimesia sp.]MAX35719.1 hypothetical protein [Gimesia sp.]HAH45368.1 hypothetical protein [Planctomycetaceae bacterium]
MLQQTQPTEIKVIFVDWHGVLSLDPFWISILRNAWHPLHQQLSEATENLFNHQIDRVHLWMRGELTSNQIIESFQMTPGPEFPLDYLNRKVIEDCQLMRINAPLVRALQDAKTAGTKIVLATDNMDCFFEAIQQAKQQRKCIEEETISFASTVQLFDDILCSSEQRILKREDPQRFFANWLKRQSFTFSNALLLDDLEINCDVFRAAGGFARQWNLEQQEETSHVAFWEI